jgi:hypothetical protein
MTRRQKRGVALAGVFAASGFFVWSGYAGMTVDSLPAHYLGYVVAAVGVAGTFGVNIWRGGPLDPRNDPKPGEAGGAPLPTAPKGGHRA